MSSIGNQSNTLLWLGQVGIEHLPRVGAKLARLGELRSSGSRVPDGFVLTVEAFDAFLSEPGREALERILRQPLSTPEVADAVALEARTIIEQHPFPAWLEDRICQAYDELCDRCGLGPDLSTAVRSSGVSEDGNASSFAGQYDTYLGIRSASGVLEHIRKCWASQFTNRAVDYRRHLNMPLVAQGIAVGVLQLVNARSAGVAFTLNPIDGNRGLAVVEGNWGFGESVVGGTTTPDHWLVNKADGAILEERIGAKEIWSVFDEAAGRVVEVASPPEQTSRPCLSHHEIQYLVRLADEIEAREGRPQDMEWAIAADLPFPDNVFLLQHRPETVWGDKPATEPEDEKPYDPVEYALRKLFKVPAPVKRQ